MQFRWSHINEQSLLSPPAKQATHFRPLVLLPAPPFTAFPPSSPLDCIPFHGPPPAATLSLLPLPLLHPVKLHLTHAPLPWSGEACTIIPMESMHNHSHAWAASRSARTQTAGTRPPQSPHGRARSRPPAPMQKACGGACVEAWTRKHGKPRSVGNGCGAQGRKRCSRLMERQLWLPVCTEARHAMLLSCLGL